MREGDTLWVPLGAQTIILGLDPSPAWACKEKKFELPLHKTTAGATQKHVLAFGHVFVHDKALAEVAPLLG